MSVEFGVVAFPGSCDERDAFNAIERIDGARARFLWHTTADLDGVDAVVIPGGFSYGDYLRAGAIARFSPVMKAITEYALEGRPVLGICNGFQVLCEAGLLPGALLPNPSLRFVCRQIEVIVENENTPLRERAPRASSFPFRSNIRLAGTSPPSTDSKS
jgi:phosphoribosylformylglycinamidine synthase I